MSEQIFHTCFTVFSFLIYFLLIFLIKINIKNIILFITYFYEEQIQKMKKN